jgi:hypothetical protein
MQYPPLSNVAINGVDDDGDGVHYEEFPIEENLFFS